MLTPPRAQSPSTGRVVRVEGVVVHPPSTRPQHGDFAGGQQKQLDQQLHQLDKLQKQLEKQQLEQHTLMQQLQQRRFDQPSVPTRETLRSDNQAIRLESAPAPSTAGGSVSSAAGPWQLRGSLGGASARAGSPSGAANVPRTAPLPYGAREVDRRGLEVDAYSSGLRPSRGLPVSPETRRFEEALNTRDRSNGAVPYQAALPSQSELQRSQVSLVEWAGLGSACGTSVAGGARSSSAVLDGPAAQPAVPQTAPAQWYRDEDDGGRYSQYAAGSMAGGRYHNGASSVLRTNTGSLGALPTLKEMLKAPEYSREDQYKAAVRYASPARLPKSPEPTAIIALDVDEVLVRYMDGFRKFMERERPTGPLDIVSVFHEAHSPDSELRMQFTMQGGLDNLDAVPGAAEALQRLQAAGCRLEAVTSRPPIMRESTEALLLKLYPGGTFSAAHFVSGGQKGVTCNAIGARALVDDQIPNVIDSDQCGVVSVLFNFEGEYPWCNCEPQDLPPAVRMCTNWEDTCDFLFAQLGLTLPQQSGLPTERFRERSSAAARLGVSPPRGGGRHEDYLAGRREEVPYHRGHGSVPSRPPDIRDRDSRAPAEFSAAQRDKLDARAFFPLPQHETSRQWGPADQPAASLFEEELEREKRWQLEQQRRLHMSMPSTATSLQGPTRRSSQADGGSAVHAYGSYAWPPKDSSARMEESAAWAPLPRDFANGSGGRGDTQTPQHLDGLPRDQRQPTANAGTRRTLYGGSVQVGPPDARARGLLAGVDYPEPRSKSGHATPHQQGPAQGAAAASSYSSRQPTRAGASSQGGRREEEQGLDCVIA
eukprot:TRINITY_DN17184_c0_g1_i1.p1 TRINITY_DN17184_c0_g1~~TRINITY_DN17184_c0_g1_i1.p1  ORF type:complete len:821 (-),score=130.48 TRINITY_DN17184_c0_g1_i1:116-2578(-)